MSFSSFLNVKKCAAALALGATLLASAQPASACGGFFCSRTPVDQTAERIIFTVNGDDTVTAYIQIQYFGDRDNFAWIVPVPDTPELDVFPQLAFQAIDLATEPVFYGDQCFLAEAAGAAPSAADNSTTAPPPSVTVVARQEVGPFDTVTLEGTNAEVLIDWLQNNDYRITDAMEPYIQKYVDDSMLFVAMKLLPDADVADIQPISMTYKSDRPMIPIRLTTVAAQPEMGVKVWVLASRRYAPDNYVDLKIEDSSIYFNPNSGQTNYLTVVSREADQVGGHAFVTEYAASTADLQSQLENQYIPPDNQDALDANEALLGIVRAHPYVTRFYTRMSAEEMNDDPYFKAADNQADVSNVHDLSTGNNSGCNQPPPPPPCAFTYCGRQGVCVETVDGDEACACQGGLDAVARPTTTQGTIGADGLPTYCEPSDFNFMDPASDTFPDACDGFDCGSHGECALMNGNPTCRCEAGYAARATTTFGNSSASIQMSCVEVFGDIPPLPILPTIGETEISPGDVNPGGGSQGNGSDFGSSSGSGGGCSVAQGPSEGQGGALGLLFGALGLVLRRRRGR